MGDSASPSDGGHAACTGYGSFPTKAVHLSSTLYQSQSSQIATSSLAWFTKPAGSCAYALQPGNVARQKGHVMARILEGAWVLLYSISIAVLMVWWAQVPA